MKWDQDVFINNVLRLVDEKCGGTQARFNDKIGRDSVSRWKGGEKREPERPSLEVLLKVTEEFDCDLGWLLTGKKDATSDDAASQFILIKKFSPNLSGGGGTIVEAEGSDRIYSFRRDWINHRCNETSCGLFNVSGDSMSPVISDGDVVLVDMTKKAKGDIHDKKIYAFTEGNKLFVKQLEWRGLELWAIPMNGTEYRVDIEAQHFALHGQVIWVGHEVK